MGCPFSRPQYESSINENKPLLLPYDLQQQQQQKSLYFDKYIKSSDSSQSATNHNNNQKRISFSSATDINNLENSLKIYRCVKEFDRMSGYIDLYTEVDEPLNEEKALEETIVNELARRTAVSAERAKKAIQQNDFLVRDAFSQIITEKIQEIMDVTGESVFVARKALCENLNNVNGAITYCKNIRLLMESGKESRSVALATYYRHHCDLESALCELLLKRLRSSANVQRYSDESLAALIEQQSYDYDKILSQLNTGLSSPRTSQQHQHSSSSATTTHLVAAAEQAVVSEYFDNGGVFDYDDKERLLLPS